MLKKLLCFILSALLLCACLPASAEDEASPYVDIWIENSGYGTLILFADGTSIMTYFDDTTTECHWEVTQEGAKFTDGQWLNSPMELLDENTLSVSNGWAVFTRQGAEPTGVELNATPVGDEGAPFFGTWTLDSLSFDGESYSAATFGMNMIITLNQDGTAISQEDTLSETTTWYAENGYAVVDGLLLSINADGQLVLEEDGAMMIFLRGEGESSSEELSEEEMLLALLAMMDQLDADEQDLSALPEALQGFVGEWYMVYTATGGLTGDLRTMGVNCTLTLNADGTGSIDFPTHEDATWYDDEGIVRFGESGMPMTLLEGGFLQYGSEMGGYMIFSQDELAVFDPAILAPAAAPAATETPVAPAEVFTSNEDYLNRRFVVASYTMAGQTYDASTLGVEYALFFRENGTCDFTLAGMEMPNLPWGLDQVAVGLTKVDAFAINYYGTAFNAVPTPTGFDLDYYGTMTLHFVPAE